MPSRVRVLENVPAQETTAPPATAEASTERRMVVAPAAAPPAAMVPQAPTLKLSFGGVDFSLLPRQNSDGTVTFEAMGTNEAQLRLQNFTGALRVQVTPMPLVRQDSVTPSPHQQQQQQQHHANTMNLLMNTASPSAPTPTIANAARRPAVEQVVAANRSSPLPYHSPVKRSRSSRSNQANKKSRPLSQKLPPTPIATQKSPPAEQRRLSEPDCSQTLPSSGTQHSSSQVSLEDHSSNHNSFEEEKEEEVQPSQSLLQQDEAEEDEEIMEDATDNKEEEEKPEDKTEEKVKNIAKEDEESVATRKAEDEDDESLATKNAEEDETMEDKGEDFESTTLATSTETVVATHSKPIVTPTNRWGHNLTMVDHNRLLVYGGQAFAEAKGGDVVPTTLSDVHVFDLEKKQWFEPLNDKTRQHPRQWATSTYIPNRQLLIVLGGEHMNPKTGRVVTSDKNNLMVLDTEILLWYPPQVSGDLPTGRSGHTSTLLPSSANNEVVMIGGVKASKHLNSVHVLDTKVWKWHAPNIQGTAPRGRSYHSATAIPATPSSHHHIDHISNSQNAVINIHHRIVLFGGNDHNESFNNVSVLEKTEPAATWRWYHPSVSGSAPKPRTGHTATLLADNKTICIYGGWDPNDEESSPGGDDLIFEDSFLLDTESWSWKKGPSPVFAGHSLDASQGGTDGGARRAGHCAVLNTTNNNDASEILIWGGRIPGDDFSGDFQTLTIPL